MNTETALTTELVPNALESLQRAEVDMQIRTAKQYPRQLHAVKAQMMSFATLDEETAESCFYSLPRGGKNIQGPSVRLAEIAVSSYQNLRVGSRVISTDTEGSNPHVVIQSVCHDLQNNVAVSIEKRRRIVGKKSKGGVIDEDDINLAANAGAAIAFRDAVFKVVPLALIKPVYEAAKRVAVGDQKTLADRRARAVDTFGKMGIAKERLLATLGKASVEDIGLAELETLLGIHTAIRDGALNIDEAFPVAAKPVYQFKDADKKLDDVRNTPDVDQVPAEVKADLVTQAQTTELVGPLTPIEKAMLEIPGATFDDFREFAACQFPQSDFSACAALSDFLPLVISELSKPAKLKALKVWLRSAVEQRGAK